MKINMHKIKEKLFCPLVSALIQLFVLYFFFFQFVEKKPDCHCYQSEISIIQK